jgi:hypothetical protein
VPSSDLREGEHEHCRENEEDRMEKAALRRKSGKRESAWLGA